MKKTHRSVAFASLALLLGMYGLSFLLEQTSLQEYCRPSQWCRDGLELLFYFFILIFPLFLFSLITYRMHERVVRAWLWMSAWAIPISMVIILLSPSDSDLSGYGIGSSIYPSWSQGSGAFILSILYAIASIGTILVVRYRIKR